MRTSEERIRLVHERTEKLRRIRKKRQQHWIDMACVAVCLVLLVGVSLYMPIQMAEMSSVHVSHVYGTASILGNHECLGYIVIAIFSFLLGVSMTVLLYRLHLRSEQSQRENEKDEL